MFKQTLLVVSIGLASATICNQDVGFWLNSHAEGVIGFAYGGVALNSKYNCFQGSLSTKIVDQAFKVAFNGSAPTPTMSPLSLLKEQKPSKRTVRLSSSSEVVTEKSYDFNLANCVDPALREGVADAISKSTDRSCKGIVKTILFNMNLQQWAVNCIDFDKSSSFQQSSDVISDYNFCNYQTTTDDDVYIIRMAKIDMS